MFLSEDELAAEQLREKREPFRWRVPSAAGMSFAFHVGLLLLVLRQIPKEAPLTADLATLRARRAAKNLTPPMPVQFYELPKRAAEAPEPTAVLSDADRRAHGGDPSAPPAAIPRARGSEAAPGPKPASPERPAPRATPSPAQPEQRVAEARPSPASPKEEESRSIAEQPSRSEGPSLLALRRDPKTESTPRSDAPGFRMPAGAPVPKPIVSGGGGGGPDRDGPDTGFVDEGGISFDTKWFDWGPYGAEMVRRIKQNWRVPDLAKVGMKGIVVIRFYVLADGSIVDEKIVKSSGIPPFDNAAFQAIAESSPLPRLPKELGSEREGVTVSFYYNIRPPSGG